MSIKLGILKGFTQDWQLYVGACEELGVKYEVIDFISSNWLELINKSNCDGFLARPPCSFQEKKNIYDERLYLLSQILKKTIYPSFNELFLYENKRNVAAWLKAHGFPHPETRVFAKKEEALEYLKNAEYPLVFKANIGSGAKRVNIVKSRFYAKALAELIFGIHPKLALGATDFIKKCGIKIFPNIGDMQKHYLIVQKFKEIKWEWRIIKVGKSYFGHQKLAKNGFCSGSDLVGWVEPPKELLFLAKEICEKGMFDSMAIDIFETTDNKYLVNELQSIFGSYLESQMYINNIPGRFVFKDNDFVFEEGIFNRHGSHLLRVEDFLEKLHNRV